MMVMCCLSYRMWCWWCGFACRYPNEWYNGEPFTPDEDGYILGVLRLVGGVELRQMRVSNTSCTERRFAQFGQRFDSKTGECFAGFNLFHWYTPWQQSTEATVPFGPPSDPDKWTFTEDL